MVQKDNTMIIVAIIQIGDLTETTEMNVSGIIMLLMPFLIQNGNVREKSTETKSAKKWHVA